jgi:Tfp pilus assembly protein PilF
VDNEFLSFLTDIYQQKVSVAQLKKSLLKEPLNFSKLTQLALIRFLQR